MAFWNRKKKEPVVGAVKLKPLNYPPKIIIGWGEAIGGNDKLRDYFLQSEDYKELGMFCYAIRLKDDAREWLMKNGYAHLMAMINGVEGNKEALHWLEKSGFQVLKHIALAGDGDPNSTEWLRKNHKEFAIVAQRINTVKQEIEDNHNDVHKFGMD